MLLTTTRKEMEELWPGIRPSYLTAWKLDDNQWKRYFLVNLTKRNTGELVSEFPVLLLGPKIRRRKKNL